MCSANTSRFSRWLFFGAHAGERTRSRKVEVKDGCGLAFGPACFLSVELRTGDTVLWWATAGPGDHGPNPASSSGWVELCCCTYVCIERRLSSSVLPEEEEEPPHGSWSRELSLPRCLFLHSKAGKRTKPACFPGLCLPTWIRMFLSADLLCVALPRAGVVYFWWAPFSTQRPAEPLLSQSLCVSLKQQH